MVDQSDRQSRGLMRANKGLLLSAMLISTMLAGCIGKVRQPEVQLAGVRVGGLGLRGATLIADLEIKNPNSFTIETDSIVYTFEAADPNQAGGWSQVTQGNYNQRIQVKDGGKTAVEVPIEFNYTGMSSAMQSILNRGTFNYRVHGAVFVREPLHRTIPFTKSGNVSLQGVR